MSLTRWDPNRDLFADFDDVFGRFPLFHSGHLKSFVPAVDMYETDKEIMVETPLANVRPEDVDVSVEKGVLTVKGQTKKEHEVEEKDYYRKETRGGSFYREIALPAAVAEDKVKAEFEDGVLKITCPKAVPAKSKKVNIKVVKKEGKKK